MLPNVVEMNGWYILTLHVFTRTNRTLSKRKKRKILIETTQAQIKLKITPIILRNVNNVIQHFYSTQSYLYKVREDYIGTIFGLHCSSFPLAKKIVCLMTCQKIVNKTCRNNGMVSVQQEQTAAILNASIVSCGIIG